MVEVTNTGEGRALAVEGNGINVISDAERTGRPADLFWPWFGANVSVLGLSYGAFVLGFEMRSQGCHRLGRELVTCTVRQLVECRYFDFDP